MDVLIAAALPRFFCALLLALGLAGAAGAAGIGAPQVHFAGVAYTGAADQAADRLPYTDRTLKRRGHAAFNSLLSQALAARPPAHFQLQPTTQMAAIDGSGSALVMAAAIDRETVVIEPVAGQYKLLFELAAQALFFDFRERQVLFSYPVTLQRIELYAAEPTREQIQKVADDVLLGAGDASLPAALADELTQLTLPSPSSRRLQVTDVHMADAPSTRLPASIDSAIIAHEFSKVLASTLRLPMLPYASGQAIGGAMAARFADGTVFNLAIPQPDYRISLEVSDFREKKLSETPAVRQQLYGAFFRVRVDEPLSAKVFFDQPLRHGATKAIPASQGRVDTPAAYYETLLGGFSSFALATAGGDGAWGREQTGGRDFARQLKSLRELIHTCR